MKAIVINEFGPAENLIYSDVDKPVIDENQVLIKNYATSLNAPDIIQRLGHYPPAPGESDILGLEVAGVIDQVGSAVTGWQIGDRVMALIGGGGYAEYASAHEDHLMKIPAKFSFAQAACICETYITAYLNVFLLGGLKNTDKVLLHGGGGGVNTAAIHLCKNLLADATVFVTASPAKIERVKALGVDHVIDYTKQSFADEIAQLTQKKGVDVILDHIGGPYLQPNMKSLAVGGRLMQIGVSKGVKAEINLALMMVKRQQIIGSVLRSRPSSEKADIIDQFSKSVLPLFEQGIIEPLISDVYSLEDASQAHQAMEKGSHFGKIVIQINKEES